jgi:hypothetical protein
VINRGSQAGAQSQSHGKTFLVQGGLLSCRRCKRFPSIFSVISHQTAMDRSICRLDCTNFPEQLTLLLVSNKPSPCQNEV